MKTRDRILERLLDGVMTVDELALAAHVHWVTASGHVRALHAAQLVHVIDWRRSPSGNPAAIYAFGPGRDKPRPGPVPASVKCARWRDKNRGLIVAKRRAKKEPINPFAGIYLGLKS